MHAQGLVGRCCLLQAQHLHAAQQDTHSLLHGGGSIGLNGMRYAIGLPVGLELGLYSMLWPYWLWLSIPIVSQQLAVLGYNPRALQQAVTQAIAACDGEQLGKSSSSGITTLGQKLQAAGTVLASVAVRGVCNNPACTNVDGGTELSIVADKGRCSGCRTAYYCSSRCQRVCWPRHKPMCKALAAAAAGPAAEAE